MYQSHRTRETEHDDSGLCTVQSDASTTDKDEQPGYLQQGDEQIYYVLHRPTRMRRIGQVLLAGPYGAERHRSYISWIRWARYLADHGLEVLRFDYRGVGESTGQFTSMAFSEWQDDLQRCARWLRERGSSEDGPLILHGWRLGALLAAQAFERDSMGDALLLWSPPSSAREMMRAALRFRFIEDYTLNDGAPRKTADDYIAEIQSGGLVEVDGVAWSPRLWAQSADVTLSLPDLGPTSESNGQCADRHWRILHPKITKGPMSLSRGSTPGGLNPDMQNLFAPNLDWIRRQCDTSQSPLIHAPNSTN